MSRLLIVSNRLPVTVSKQDSELHYKASVGGLATGLASLKGDGEQKWIGWPGMASDIMDDDDKQALSEELHDRDCCPVLLSTKEVDDFYLGFCNGTIWPLFHYFPIHTRYEEKHWQSYKEVNQKYCDAILEEWQPGDEVWIHDYQLMLLPKMIRDVLPDANIGFFLHIPFPSVDIFRLLPWREEILDGLFGADLIGFHTYDYVRHFLSTAIRLCGYENTMGEITVGNRIVKIDAFPMGIDYEKFNNASEEKETQEAIKELSEKAGDRKVIISVDRLDYTKGLIQRLEAYDAFLRTYPEYKEKVILVLLVVPSRDTVSTYKELKLQIEQLVGRINGIHGSMGWVPIWYIYRSLPFNRLAALYGIGDVGLITPLRDGMNLVAKEYVASRKNRQGVLILSEMAGAAQELPEAIIVNSNNRDAIVSAIRQSLEMPIDEQIHRNAIMQYRLSRYTVSRWASDFMDVFNKIKAKQKSLSTDRLSIEQKDSLIDHYATSKKRLFLLDYDGTLVGFTKQPEQAQPDQELELILQHFIKDSDNTVVIISGRDHMILDKWFADLPVTLIAEHGAWVKEVNGQWHSEAPKSEEWKEIFIPILEQYSDRTPGSFTEEKDFSIVWHYRKCDPELASRRVYELRHSLTNLIANMDIGIHEGNKILEMKKFGTNKGDSASKLLSLQSWDFIFAAGDDYTDEDMFNILPDSAYSIHVGYSPSKARFSLPSVQRMRHLLKQIAGRNKDEYRYEYFESEEFSESCAR